MNIDPHTVRGFGKEWTTFNRISDQDDIFQDYFRIFPWNLVDKYSCGLDFGCGNGRWAALVAPHVLQLVAVDVPEVLAIARENLASHKNVLCFDVMPELTFDFAYSLGVLHHVPDTQAALNDIASRLRPGAPFLVYLYYSFDNRPRWYRLLWKLTDIARHVISRLPHSLRLGITFLLAALVYWPLSRVSSPGWPLSYYSDKSFYIMRNDAYDRFSTRLEKRFSREQIETMLRTAGFEHITFSSHRPYWCAVGLKTKEQPSRPVSATATGEPSLQCVARCS